MKNRMNSKIAESRSRSSSPAPQQPSPSSSNQATQPITVQPVEDKRWRPEEIELFDDIGDVYAFTNRLASIAELKTPKLIQTNLVTLLKGTAFN